MKPLVTKWWNDMGGGNSNSEASGHMDNIASSTMEQDIKFLISQWFCSLDDAGIDPWEEEECRVMADKYNYTRDDFQRYLRSLS